MVFKIIINTGFNDRIMRFVLAITFFIIAFFWVSGVLEFLFYFLGIVFLITSFTGFCRIYKTFGISSCKNEKYTVNKSKKRLLVILILVGIVLGCYLSITLTNKIFLNDFEKFNSPYKQALFYSQQNNRDKAVDYYSVFKLNFNSFKNKYSNYRPYSIRSDKQFGYDIIKVTMVIGDVDKTIDSSNLTIANQQLKELDPVLNDIIRRNSFSLSF